MIRVLFICHGNICRSPLAEFVLKDMVKNVNRTEEFQIDSAATTTEEIWGSVGNPIYPPALEELMKHGIGTPDNELGVHAKRARLLTASDYQNYDYIIGMDAENARDMRRILGKDPEGKVSLLLDWTDHPRDVRDPWYTRNFGATWDDVNEGCIAFLQAIGFHR